MTKLSLKTDDLVKLKSMIVKLEDKNGNNVYFVPPVFNSGCDKYDCWFGSTKCTCQGICDGRN